MRQAILLGLIMGCCLPAVAVAQDYDDYEVSYDYGTPAPVPGLRSTHLVDSPTAVLLRHGDYRITGRLMSNGSIVALTEVGIKDRFSVGVAWGMQGLLGRGEVDVNEKTGISLRLLLLEELDWPAVLIGFDNQGYGRWYGDADRYERKSKGFYVTLTRNWYGPVGSDVATTAGVNYSTETEDEDSPDFFFGLEADFGNRFAFIGEYSLGLDDNREDHPAAWGEGKGWLDLGLRWNIQEQIQFKFFFRDLLGNYQDHGPVDRQLEISYQGSF